jgi:hypothetical protein
MRYRVEVLADSSGKWCGNGMTFASTEEAREYAFNLAMRWTAVRDWRVVEVAETSVDERGVSKS